MKYSRNSAALRCFTLLAILVVAVLGCQKPTSDSDRNDGPLRIGVFLPLTGEMQPYGVNAREGLVLAQEEINQRGGVNGRIIELIVLDDKGEQIETLNVVKQLVSRDGVRLLIGGLTSSGTLDAANYAKDKQVLLFSPAASHPDIPRTGFPYFIRNWQSDTLAAEAAATFAFHDLGAKKAAVLYVNNAYGQGQRNAFMRRFASLGGQITIEKGFAQDDTSVIRTLLTAIKGAAPEVIFVPAYPREYQEILLQASNLKLQVPRIATDTFEDPSLQESVKEYATNLYYVVAASPDQDYAPASDFRAKYQARFKTVQGDPKQPGLVSDTAYDALHLVADAVAEVGLDPASVATAIRSRKGYRGAAGITSFTELGDVDKPVVVKQLRDGKAAVEKRF